MNNVDKPSINDNIKNDDNGNNNDCDNNNNTYAPLNIFASARIV